MRNISVLSAARVRRFAGALGAAALAATIAACSSDGPAGPIDGPGTGATGAKLGVINGAPGAVRVVVDGATRIASLPASTVSAALDVGPGAHTVELQAIGSGSFSGASSTSVTAAAGGTAFVTARAASGGAVVAGVVADTGAIPAAGMSKLRVIHMAANAPALDVWRTQPDYTTPIRTMFPFPYMAQTPYLQSTPGSWEVIVTTASVPTAGEPDPRLNALATLSVTVNANVAQTMVILDKAGGGVTLSLLPGN